MCAMGSVGRLNRNGMEACRRGQFEEAEEKLLAALELAQSVGGSCCTTIKIHNNLGIVYELRGCPDRAVHHYGTALELMNAIGSGKHPFRGRLLQSLTRAASSVSSPG